MTENDTVPVLEIVKRQRSIPWVNSDVSKWLEAW